MKLLARVVSTDSLTSDDRQAMFALMERHYARCEWHTFSADLEEKQWVISIHESGSDKLCGFSTQMVLDVMIHDQPARALFSGDTIIDRDHWGDHALMHEWGRFALRLIDSWSQQCPLYWFLISQGYKTYRFLPLFFHEFYPRYDVTVPDWAVRTIDAFARHKFPSAYDGEAGVVRAGDSHYRLHETLCPLTANRLTDPHIKYFAQRNPGHADGDELCCLAPLTRENFTAAAYRVINAKPLAWTAECSLPR